MEYFQYLPDFVLNSIFKSFVLNLVINGIPSIPRSTTIIPRFSTPVLNLVINGIPSILSTELNYINKYIMF